MRVTRSRVLRLGVVAGVVVATVSCVSDKVVYRDAASFTPPAAAAASFVGYSRTSEKQTVCGNCHVDQQAKWALTGHADAWADLQASGHATGTCEACHSVSKLGNVATKDSVGYVGTRDERYQDVQCESCHGPGLSHVTTPTLANRPLASMTADTGTTLGNGCGECHTGTHEPFVDEWRSSVHGQAPHAQTAWSRATAATPDLTCRGCHTGQYALARFGVNTNYLEKDATTPQPLTCVVCHDPHGGSGIGKQLRLSVTTSNTEENLCMKCHQRRANPDQPNYSSNRPHSPEGQTLLGYSGWFPPLMRIATGDTVIATHGTDRNPRLCAGCHVNRWTVTDPKTGSFAFQVTGHRFEATPCVDATGKPTGKADCTSSERAFKGCTASGCHGSEAAARNALATAETRVDDLAAEVDAMIALIPATEISSKDGKYTSAEGAQFNAALARTGGAVAHNPFLIEQLLTASIKQMQQDYGILPRQINLDNILQRSR